MFLLIFLVNFIYPFACQNDVDQAIKSLNETIENTETSKSRNIIFEPAKLLQIISDSKFLGEKNGRIYTHSKQNKSVELFLSFSKDKKNNIIVNIKRTYVKHTYSFNLTEALHPNKIIDKLSYLGGGSRGLVFRAEYTNGDKETLKIYYIKTSNNNPSYELTTDFIKQELLYHLFKSDNNVAIAKYTILNRKIKINTDHFNRMEKKFYIIPVVKVQNLEKANTISNIYRQISIKQNQNIFNDIKNFFIKDKNNFFKQYSVSETGNIKGTLSLKAVKRLYKIERIYDFTSIEKFFEKFSNVELEIIFNNKNQHVQNQNYFRNIEMHFKFTYEGKIGYFIDIDLIPYNSLILKDVKQNEPYIYFIDPD